LLLGDAAFAVMRGRRREIVVEWAAASAADLRPLVTGRWEYAVGGGWRSLPVELAATEDTSGAAILRLRARGPLPDMAVRAIDGAELPWWRWIASGDVGASVDELVLPEPRIAWSSEPDMEGGALPRPVARLLVASDAAASFRPHGCVDRSLPTDGSVDVGAVVRAATVPTVMLGFDRPFSTSLYWQLTGGAQRASSAEPASVVWEYSTAAGYRELELEDGTEGLARSGTTAWRAPADWVPIEAFGRRLAWVRARPAPGAQLSPVAAVGVWPQAVEVVEGRGLRDCAARVELDGSSDAVVGTLLGIAVEAEPFDVLEVEARPGEWTRLDRCDAFAVGVPEPGWFRLRRTAEGGLRVELPASFAGGGCVAARVPAVRVGLAPAVGAGDREGVPAGTLDVLEADLPEVAGVAQPLGVTAGAPVVDAAARIARLRAEWLVSGRAVTADDFRRLACAFDPDIARVEVVVSAERPWETWVVVCGARDVGSRRLAALERYLEPRVLVGTTVRVVKPCALPFSIEIAADADRNAFEGALRKLLDPLTGGLDGVGCPLGKDLRFAGLESIIARAREGCGVEGIVAETRFRTIESALQDGESLDPPIGLPVLVAVCAFGDTPSDGKEAAPEGADGRTEMVDT